MPQPRNGASYFGATGTQDSPGRIGEDQISGITLETRPCGMMPQGRVGSGIADRNAPGPAPLRPGPRPIPAR